MEMTAPEQVQPRSPLEAPGPGPDDEAFGEAGASRSPARLFLMVSAVTFVTEIIVMLLLAQLPSLSSWFRALVDAILLNLLLFPALYYLVFQPMRLYVTQLSRGQKRLQKEITERKGAEKALRESEKELRSLSSQILAVQERERRWLSREMHEELGQTLAMVKAGLSSMANQRLRQGAGVDEEFERNLAFIDLAIQNVRRIHRLLGPSIVEELGLPVALQRLVDNVIKRCGVKVTLDLVGMDRFFSQRTQMIIYRILQEALANVERHSHATRLSLVIQPQDGEVSFSVEDNGTGFDVKGVAADGAERDRLGLTTMCEAAKMAGGSLDIESGAGGGTRLTFTIPVDHA